MLSVVAPDGTSSLLDTVRLRAIIDEACVGLADVSADAVFTGTTSNLYDGISTKELGLAPIMAARALVETEPNYSFVAARLLADTLRTEALSYLAGSPTQVSATEMADTYAGYFKTYVATGIELGQLDPMLAEFDLDAIGAALDSEPGRPVHLPRAADAVRPLLPALPRHPLRAAAGVLHARGHGSGHPRGRTARSGRSSSTG